MLRRTIAALSAFAVVGAWVVCAVSFATDRGGGYDIGFLLFALLAIGSTALAVGPTVRVWKRSGGIAAGAGLSLLAVVLVLWLSLALRLRG